MPHIRRVRVPETGDGRPVYLPIETFGRVYMQGDDWHTDAVGYDLIAHAVARVGEGLGAADGGPALQAFEKLPIRPRMTRGSLASSAKASELTVTVAMRSSRCE